jgi:macrolide transport system ATP-binding/permease protein
MFEIKDLSFSYRIASNEVHVLKNLNLKVHAGEFICIQGPSGSGKSTLFYILGFLLKPTHGQVLFDGIDITRLSKEELTVARNQRIGFVFQQFHLLSKTSVLDNILLPTRYPSEIASPRAEHLEKAKALARQLGLQNHFRHFPNQLSGGQQQRVAIARALVNDIELILADEPTGNLDSSNAQQILALLSELNRQGKTIILITHDSEVAKQCSKVYHLKDGSFVRVEENYSPVLCQERPRLKSIPPLSKKVSFQIYKKIAQSVFPVVCENLLRNKVKSMLTMLGVVIGIAAVLSMVTLGQFTKKKILETYEALGVNKLLIRGYSNWNLKATDQVSVHFQSFEPQKDFFDLKRIFPEIRLISPELQSWNNVVTAGGIVINEKVTAIGVSAEYLAITNRVLQMGRNFSPFHIENKSPVCLIGFEIAQRLFARVHPLGQMISVSNGRSDSYPCQVIGVLAANTSNKDWSPPNLNILMPYSYFQTMSDSRWSAQMHEITLQVSGKSDVEATGKKIRSYFEEKYGKSGVFFVDSDSNLIAQMKRFLNLFTILLASIALLSLLVGGIGINNMMLVSVAERIKEFGIRKALGATNRSIRVQVLMESMTLCGVAGIVGALFGFGAYELVIFGASQFVPRLQFEWVMDPFGLVLSMVSILAVGIASGLVPALRAEKLQVIEALRTE